MKGSRGKNNETARRGKGEVVRLDVSFRRAADRDDGVGDSMAERIRQGMVNADLDCRCRDAAEQLLERFGREEYLLRRASGLAEARSMRDAIAAVLALLGDLDELMPDEPDASAFREMADLFRDIRDFADRGAEAARALAGESPVGRSGLA